MFHHQMMGFLEYSPCAMMGRSGVRRCNFYTWALLQGKLWERVGWDESYAQRISQTGQVGLCKVVGSITASE